MTTTTTTTTTKKLVTAKLLAAFASRGDAALQPVRVPQIPPEAAKEGKESRECDGNLEKSWLDTLLLDENNETTLELTSYLK